MFSQMEHFCFPDLGKEKLFSVLVFGNLCFNIVVRINHDNVASRGAVGRTHTIVRLQTRIRRKDGTENFGGFVFVLDLYNGILCCGFLCARVISVSFPATTPRATTPVQIHSSYQVTTSAGLPHPSYHAPYKLLGIDGLSHLRVGFSYFSSHRLIHQ